MASAPRRSKAKVASLTRITCIDAVRCDGDVYRCPDGSFVARVSDNGCKFAACREGIAYNADGGWNGDGHPPTFSP